jgi:hypothetical protein
MTRLAFAVVLVATMIGTALAAPPPDADPSLSQWFESLRQPGSGASCCSISDCHRLKDGQWRETASGYEIEIRGQWVAVPRSRILNHVQNNPTGGAVACYSEALRTVYCFVRGSET